MYVLKTESSFDSAHFLSGYEGKCANIHGHRWLVRVEICGENLESVGQEKGMLTDFGKLKADVKKMTDEMDHCFIYENGSLKEKTIEALREENFKLLELPFRPTAENFARFFYEKIKKIGYTARIVTVFETPNNCASYYE